MEDQDLIAKNSGEYNRADKLKLLSLMRISVGLGIFLALVQTTNLFLINSKANNPITLGWGILTILVTLTNIINLLWSQRLSKSLGNNSNLDPYGLNTDNVTTRVLFVLNLLLTFGFIIFFIIYKFAQSELYSHFQMINEVKFLDGFKNYLAEKNSWMNFLSLVNIGVGAHAVVTYFAMAGSQPAIRFYIFSVAGPLVAFSFLILNQFNVLASVFHLKEDVFSWNNWNDRITWSFAIVAIPLSLLVYICNYKKLKNGLLILGSILLVLVAIQGSAAGQTYRDYKTVDNHFRNRCGPELSKIHRNYIETFPCNNKYVYENKGVCPVIPSQISTCVKDRHLCDKSLLMRAWEENITKDNTYPTYACAQEKCCGALYIIYTSPVLGYATLVLTWCLLAFAVSTFTFLISSKPNGDPLNPLVISFFYILLAIILIGGGFLLGLHKIEQIPKTPLVTQGFEQNSTPTYEMTVENHHKASFFNQLNKSLKHGDQVTTTLANDEASYSYKGDESCPFFITHTQKLNEERLFKFPAAAADKTNSKQDLADWIPAEEKFETNSIVKQKGYLICIASYAVAAGGKKIRFKLPENFEAIKRNKAYQIDGYSCGKNVFEVKGNADFAYNKDRSYIGFLGTKDEVDQILKNELKVCEETTPTADNNKFTIIVSEIDLEGHSGDRLLSEHYIQKGVLPTEINAAFPTADADKQIIQKTTYIRSFTINVTDSENGRAPLPYAYFGLLGAPSTGPATDRQCETDFSKTPMDKDRKGDPHFRGQVNDIGQTRVVMVLSLEAAGEGDVGTTSSQNRSPYVGLSTRANNYRLYAWRWVDGKIMEYNCKEFQVSAQNKVRQEEVQLSRHLAKNQVRVVLHWRDPTIDLDLLTTFGQKGEFFCNVAAFDNECGRVRHYGETLPGVNGTTTEVITLTNPGPIFYAIYLSQFVKADTMDEFKTDFQNRVRDALPVITYYIQQNENDYDSIVAVARPYSTDATNTAMAFTNCNTPADCTAADVQDSNTRDLANVAFCVNGLNNLNHEPKTFTQEGKAFGFTWDNAHTDSYDDTLKKLKNKEAMFPTNAVCDKFTYTIVS